MSILQIFMIDAITDQSQFGIGNGFQHGVMGSKKMMHSFAERESSHEENFFAVAKGGAEICSGSEQK